VGCICVRGSESIVTKRRILAVDDNPRVTTTLSIGLGRKGYEVRTENEPMAVFRAARDFKPDLVLLDVMMPPMDGCDLANKLRAHPVTAGIPILFLTSIIRRDEIGKSGTVIGGDEFIAKPASIEEISNRILRRLK